MKNSFKATFKLDRFKRSDSDKSQSVVNKTQKKRFVKSQKTNEESDELQNNIKFESITIRIQMTNSQFDINVTNSIITLFIDDNRKQSSQTQSFQNFSSDDIIDYATKLIEIQRINVRFEVKRQYKIK